MEPTSRNTLCNTTMARMSSLVMSLPALGVFSTVIYSLMYDFKATTKTHCRVYNFLPSISAAIANPPQCYMWRICITLHAAPRFMVAMAYYNWHKQVHVGKSQWMYMVLVRLAIIIHVLENFMLVLLTIISSTENKDIHEWCFIMFIVMSWSYMLLTIYIISWANGAVSTRSDSQDRRSLLYKKVLAVMNILGFCFAINLYFRHNWYCEPMVYSWFAFFEYLTIFTNIGFHGTIIFDMRDYSAGVVLTDLIQKQR